MSPCQKTIDNDIVETNSCFGFDTAVSYATEAIDRLHATAHAHHRIVVVEVMGRDAGWIALHAGGADAILIPEIPFYLAAVAECIHQRDAAGARFSIVVVAEGAHPVGGQRSVVASASEGKEEQLMGKEARAVVLGHLQRGGAPTAQWAYGAWSEHGAENGDCCLARPVAGSAATAARSETPCVCRRTDRS